MLKIGGTIGILGGGQLARMLAVAASRIGYQTHIYDPNPDSPAFDVASSKTIGSFQDKDLLKEFAKKIDLATFEFENVPDASLKEIENIVSIFPTRNALSISQDRIKEKQFFNNLTLKTVQYAPVDTFEDFSASIAKIKIPSILKTCRQGYDGKGQLLITKNTTKREIEKHLLLGPCILESFIDFNKEVSVVLSRNQSGHVVSFDPGENIHRAGILQRTIIPAQIPKMVQIDLIIIAGKIINALEYVGVLGVETFLSHQNEIIINEIAPRVHNSGHWTQNGCAIDQFEQHIRAISGRKLGDGERHSDVTMVNILGKEIDDSLNVSNAALHLYGKKEIREGRKMGHINYISKKTS